MPGNSSGPTAPRPHWLLSRPQRVIRFLRQHRTSFAISFSVTVVSFYLYFAVFVGQKPTPAFEFLERLELSTLDTRFLYRPGRFSRPDPRIIIVDIDQRSQELLGRWPFSRVYFARLLDALRKDGASVAAFDVTFSKPDQTAAPLRALAAQLEDRRKQGEPVDPRLTEELAKLEQQFNADKQFAEAIERFGPVVLGNFFLYTQADLEGLSDATLDRYANLMAFFPFPSVRPLDPSTGKQDRIRLIQEYDRYRLIPRGTEANTDELTNALTGDFSGVGFFNVQPDVDGVVRRALTVLPYGRSKNLADWDFYSSLDIQAVRLFLRLPNDQVILYVGPGGIHHIEFGSRILLRPDAIGREIINYRGPVRTYRYVSFADVVNRNFAAGTFRGKIVLVGASATGIGDLRTTPYEAITYPGVEIHANVIDNILNQQFLKHGAKQVAVDLAVIFLFGIPLGIWLALMQPRWMWLGLLLGVPFVGGIYWAFLRDWWLNFTVPFLALVSNVGLVALYRVLVEEKEKRKVRGAFQQYLSPEVIRRLLENPDLVKPRKTEITVMFSDVRGFTTISEQLDAQELAVLLNGYLTDMTQIVFRYSGTLDKYIGDAVMAFWGAPFEEPDHPSRACRAALLMMTRLGELQKEWEAQGKPKLDIGIGLNTGVASVGNMGSTLRYGYTAMGDTVNLAARLEGLNKEFRTHILVTEKTYAAVQNGEFLFRELDLIRVKGKLQPATIYELVGMKQSAAEFAERLGMFAEGRSWYLRREWSMAQKRFEQVLERWPDDGPSRTFWKRCQDYLFEEPEAKWDGVYVMTHK